MLEQIAYEVSRVSEIREQVYQVGDLEELSAGALYTGHLPKMGPGGFGLPSVRVSDVGTSGYFTTIRDGAAEPDMVFKTPELLITATKEGRSLGKNSIQYADSKGWMGSIELLNIPEISYLKSLKDKDL